VRALDAILAAMHRGGEDSTKADAVERFKALHAAVEGAHPVPLLRGPGVTEDGRYAYRYDDEGRFYACPLLKERPTGP
jgi:hypothetical protein